MNTRKKLIAGNWKMHGSHSANAELLSGILAARPFACDVAVCVPFPYLGEVAVALAGSDVRWGAQDCSAHDKGAYTGEVSAAMLTELDVHGVILGHSERREFFAETDKALALKLPAALDAGLTPILCVGETEEERERGDTERKLRHQIQEGLAKVNVERFERVTIAYEPIWAIGTGNVATIEQVDEASGFVRALVADRAPEQAQSVRVLYGGSVTPDNAAAILALPDVDGVLVGGASLDAESFAAIIAAVS